MRHDPQTPTIDANQRQDGSRTDVERQKEQARAAGDARDNADTLGHIPKDGTPETGPAA